MSRRIALYTLGCKVNQYDTEAIKAQFLNRGYDIVAFNDKADIYLVNTCTVTNVSDRKSRKLIRRAHRQNPQAKIVVVGCLAQTDTDKVSSLPGVNLIVGTSNRRHIVDYIEQLSITDNCSLVEDIDCENVFEESDVEQFTERTRAFLKIQDGCNQFCSYCKVPFARGRSRSRLPERVVTQAEKLVANGYCEIVLTGVHLGAYGHDLDPRISLSDIIELVTQVKGKKRVRIGSVDPNEIDRRLIELIANNPQVCRHLHIPLQSGSDFILTRMNRRYRITDFLTIVEQVKSQIPEIAITTDVIVGFPGETPAIFEQSYRFLEQIDLAKIHVFKFSARENTPAADYPNQVAGKEKDARSHALIELSNNMAAKFNRRYRNKCVTILAESQNEAGIFGLTDNYLHVSVCGQDVNPDQLLGNFVTVRITDANQSGVSGVLS